MKKISLLALLIPVLFAGCTPQCIEDAGRQLSRDLTVKNFDRIKVEGAIQLLMVQDSSYHIRIAADSNIIKLVKADVSSDELKLKLDEDRYCGTDSIMIRVGVGELRALKLDGAVKAVAEGRIYADDLELSISGAADVNMNLSARKVVTRVDGVGKIALSGQAGVHELKINGTARVEAFDFIVGVYHIDTDGTGKANINVLNELKVKTSGSSEIYYRGNPKKVEEKKSGAAKLQKVN